MTFTSSEIAIAILALAVLILSGVVFYQERRLGKILKGKSAKDLEDSFEVIEKEYLSIKSFIASVKQYLKTVEDRLQKSVQGVGTIRFNAWKGQGEGGNQSFASAFMAENGDGIVISSLYSRDRVSIFAKPIEKGKSAYELTAEEKEAVEKAKKKTTQN